MNGLKIKQIREDLGLTQTDFAEALGVKLRAVQSWEAGDRNISQSAELLLERIIDEHSTHNEQKLNFDEAPNKNHSQPVPFYDVDFTAGFLESANFQNTKPDSYITHPFFEGCDYVVRASGHSMARLMCNGDAIGLIKLDNWREFLPFGEVYAIVTNDGHRLIKIITSGKTDEHFTLISKPHVCQEHEFPPQQIRIGLISTVFKVKASSRLF